MVIIYSYLCIPIFVTWIQSHKIYADDFKGSGGHTVMKQRLGQAWAMLEVLTDGTLAHVVLSVSVPRGPEVVLRNYLESLSSPGCPASVSSWKWASTSCTADGGTMFLRAPFSIRLAVNDLILCKGYLSTGRGRLGALTTGRRINWARKNWVRKNWA